ncbi:DUF6412 domain-containing protein [Streptomyces katrae]|uniref:DUF6412 domain-containing protein n=1 Tax=Streptomyces katrae TaxID=68223 RepID=A0ABT7H3G7_9ACTN|nr:DUF6412 domain-containing protein [Streptomyces katrae]MDK9500091.1 DUF6412 domain-containing protein [Streptomyces katrae]
MVFERLVRARSAVGSSFLSSSRVVQLLLALLLLGGFLGLVSGDAGLAAGVVVLAAAVAVGAAALAACLVRPVPPHRIRTAIRDREQRTAFLPQRDPDASGRSRPRAPGRPVMTAA